MNPESLKRHVLGKGGRAGCQEALEMLIDIPKRCFPSETGKGSPAEQEHAEISSEGVSSPKPQPQTALPTDDLASLRKIVQIATALIRAQEALSEKEEDGTAVLQD
ncbi:hypothetical protein DFQ26_005856 [Actinomortierella ambigua]|nr:hypothetical protein DFQ26_005856 [Actinomortierella ambigua]